MATVSAATGAAAGSREPRVGATLGPGWRACVDPSWLEGWNPRRFALRDGVTDVVVMGEGPTVVLVPPSPGFKEAWIATARRLAQTFRVVTFDFRCRFPGPPDFGPVLDDFTRLLDAFAPGPIALSGHSLGGAAAQHWTLAHPERVRALVLSSSFAQVRNPAGNQYARFIEQPLVVASQRLLPRDQALALARFLARHGRWVYDARCDDRLLDFVRFCMRDCPWSVARAAIRLAFAHDTRATVAGIACPTLVVVGENESVFSVPASRELARLIPGAELRVSPRASHLHPLSSAEWLAENVSGWLRLTLGA